MTTITPAMVSGLQMHVDAKNDLITLKLSHWLETEGQRKRQQEALEVANGLIENMAITGNVTSKEAQIALDRIKSILTPNDGEPG